MKRKIKTVDVFKGSLRFIYVSLTIFLVLFPILLYLIGVFDWVTCKTYLKDNNWQIWILGLSIILILLNIKVTFFSNRHHLNTIKNEIKYLFKNGKPAWILGLAFSNLFVSLYFLIPSLTKVDRFDASFGIFLGVLTIFVGIHILYDKEAPILGTINLLDKLNKDLDNYKGGDIYFVFPALNLGFYTETILHNQNFFIPDNGQMKFKIHNSPAAKLYFQIREINDKLYQLKPGDIKAVIFNNNESNNGAENYIKKFYMSYHFMISNKDKMNDILKLPLTELKEKIEPLTTDDTVNSCVESANKFLEFFLDENILFVKPNEMLQPIIVIDNIVYVIADYGMPVYDNTNDFFVPIRNESHPVELYCWRRKDASLARAIKDHIDNFFATKKPITKKP
jgi:hypothetical protein